MSSIAEIIQTYDSVVKVVDTDASEQTDRAYGGMVRSVKGKLQEHITEEIVRVAWQNLGGAENRLVINSSKIHIPIQDEYIEHLVSEGVRKHIKANIKDYFYGLSVDKHIFIDNKFVMGIECKAYTENAMIKRILVDFHLLRTLYPNISCHLFQLESQLGGDYSTLPETVYGSCSTHSIMSYFEDVDLNIFTFLKGERNIEMPIHKYFKPLKKEIIKKAVEMMESYLKEFV
ncbi:hypothetical protein FACS1894172_12930 [Spirochaetia bacterium]|nr:hypothetical protein FACS1894164_08100 [Spirochaetia bacterium]GHU33754.1 hypothetical protein FACS1894172_12930 [Spirochaetia bacterium]